MIPTRSFRLVAQIGAAAGLLWASAGCPTESPPRRPEPKMADDNEPAHAAEWLFVASEGPSVRGKKAECEKVATWVLGEKDCTGDLCVHARDLGRDWLQRCTTVLPDKVDAVQEMVDAASQRAELPDDDCVRQGNRLLREPSCQDEASCTEQAQKWVSTCGERYATPLMVLMIVRTLDRRLGEDAHLVLDTRSCATMGAQIAAGYGCDTDDECKEPGDTAVAWQSRCMGGESGTPIVLAFQVADVLVGGGKGVDPIPVDAMARAIPDGTFPLTLEDNQGVVTWVCGSRTKTLKDYLAVRQSCVQGEVIVAHLDKSHHVRTVSVPHATDADFLRLFPFLMVKGEQEARDLAALDDFTKALGEAAEDAASRHEDRAYRKLVSVMTPKIWAMVRLAAYQKAVASMDGRLEPAFKAWGKAKARAADRIRKDDEFALFVGRALASPLSDMTADGEVSPGSYATPTAFTLSTWMPRSMHAYRKELERAQKRAERRPVAPARLGQLRTQAVEDIAACAAAQKEVADAEQAAADCLFGGAACPQAKPAALSAAADAARQKAAAARARLDAFLASGVLEASEVARMDADRVTRGCLDP